jgi:3-oxoacyl-[acyl-carrier-protein] synthase II
MANAFNERRVAVTGMGAITPLGLTTAATWDGFVAGRSGIGPIQAMDTTDFHVHFGGEVKGLDPAAYLPRKRANQLERFVYLAVIAAQEAWRDSGLPRPEGAVAHRCGAIVGTGIGGLIEIEVQYGRYVKMGPSKVSPRLVPRMMANAASGEVAIELNLQGPNFCAVSACASGAHSIGLAWQTIKLGQADVMAAGGAEATVTTVLGLGGFCNIGALSRRNDDPQAASRPFEKNRDGFVLAEGAGVIVLEEMEHARKRGARIYCELAGFGMSCDAFHITQPGDGGVRGMTMAMESAGLGPEDIDYINAHGTSTPYNDKAETDAIKAALGAERAYKVPVSSVKSMIGHTLGAAGAIEAVVCAKCIVTGILPPTINYHEKDPECDLDYVPNQARQMKTVRGVLSNSLGFGGHNATLAFKKI